MTKQQPKFKPGDLVRWKINTTKEDKHRVGTVLLVLAPFADPFSYEREAKMLIGGNAHHIESKFTAGKLRAEYSYLISSKPEGQQHPRLYWPIPSRLQLQGADG